MSAFSFNPESLIALLFGCIPAVLVMGNRKRRDVQHLEREQQVQLAFNAARVGTWKWSIASGELQWDVQTKELYGLPPETSVYHIDQYFALVHPEDRERNATALEEACGGGAEFNTEFRVVHPDGSAHWIGARGAVTRDKGGEAIGMTGINIGIDGRKRAESALKESERQFANLADSIPNLAWMANPDGAIFWYNRRWYDYTATTPEQMKGWGWQSVHDPERLPEVMRAWQASIQTGKPFEMEFPLRGADLTFRWFLTRVTPVRDLAGKIVRWFGTNTDVTELREIREALRQSEQQFRHMADAMPQIVWAAAPDGDVDYYNQGWHAYTGLTLEQTKGWGWQPVLHPDDLQRTIEVWTHAFTTGEPYEIEYRFRRGSDGEFRWHLGRAVPALNAERKVVRWFGTCTDIEEQKRVELEISLLNDGLEQRVRERTEQLAAAHEEAAKTRAKLQAVLDAATQVAIIATDAAGVIQVFNGGAEKMLQYEAKEVVGRATPSLFHLDSEYRERAIATRQSADGPPESSRDAGEWDQRGESEEREWTFVRKDGSTFDALSSTTAVRNAAGAITGFVDTANDITVRKSLERELRHNNLMLLEQTRRAKEASKAKSTFLAAMSHEIRTPMNALLGMSDLLWESNLEAQQRQYVEVFRRAGHNLLTLINDLLDLSKIEAGHLELERVPFNLEEVVGRSTELIGPKAIGKGLALLCRISPAVKTSLIGDGGRLQQVLVNLLGNAVKFTDRGEVVLSVQPAASGKAGAIEFAVVDTGIGIAPEKLETIFDDFIQADTSTTRKYGGTGLGLGIARRLVECMGGRLSAESVVGAGSTFRFTANFELSTNPQNNDWGEIDFEGRCVLVVDNNETNRQILRDTLMSWGLTSVECESASEGERELLQAQIRNEPFSIILLDRHMPELDGFAAIPLLRAAAPGIPIMMLTSDERPGDMKRRTEAQVAGYALKPVRRADLLRLMCRALGRPLPGTLAKPASIQLSSASGKASGRLRILIAEDSPDNRMLLEAYLKNSTHVLSFAEDGQQAADKFTATEYDLILMDMQMPVMDGLSATRLIRVLEGERGWAPIPIIALTANAMAHDVEASRAAGCNAHLSKPISKEKLLGALAQYGPVQRDESKDMSVDSLMTDIPDELKAIVPGYLKARMKELPVLSRLLEDAQYSRIQSLAHDLKGTGSSYGFPELTRLGSELEAAAKSSNSGDLANQLRELNEYLNRVEARTLGRR